MPLCSVSHRSTPSACLFAADTTHGFVGADLGALLANAALTSVTRVLPSPVSDAPRTGPAPLVQLTWAGEAVVPFDTNPTPPRTQPLPPGPLFESFFGAWRVAREEEN